MLGRRLWGLVASLCASALLLAGCGDFFTKDTGGGGGGGGSVGSYTYVGTGSGMLAGYSVSSTGALATLSGSPSQFATAAINGLAVTPANTFLYVGVAGTGIFGSSINSGTGVPTLISSSVLVQDVAPLALTQALLTVLAATQGTVVNITSDAGVEAYEGWGGYGSSKAALEQWSAVLGVEHPDLRVLVVDPGDMRTEMHQDAFPGEDISDRPLPEAVVPGLVRLMESDHPSGRARVAEFVS